MTGDGPAVTVLASARSAVETAGAKEPFMPVRVKRLEKVVYVPPVLATDIMPMKLQQTSISALIFNFRLQHNLLSIGSLGALSHRNGDGRSRVGGECSLGK